MTSSGTFYDELERLAVLDSYNILDTPAEQAFDDVVKLVSQLLNVPVAAVNLIAKDRQWFKSEVGLGTREMPLDNSICKFALLEDQQMVVPDTREDTRFACNPLVTGEPGLRFYAGHLLKSKAGIPLGTLCVLDLEPRPQGLTQQQQFVLATLAQQIMSQIELRKALHDQGVLITRQASAQIDLRESQQRAMEVARQAEAERRRTDALLEAAPVGIIIADANGAIVKVNAENRKMWGRHPDANDIGSYQQWRGWWADGSARHGQPLGAHEWSLARALLGEESPRQVVEIESFNAAKTRRTVLNSGRPVRDETGAIIGAVIAQMDITDRVEAESALRKADQRKDEFLAMLAHELRNPLAPIVSAAAILSNFDINEATVRRTSAIIARQAGHMNALINDLLDVSRVTRGKVELETASLDIKEVIADAVEQARPLVTRHHHHLDVLVPQNLVLVNGDRKRLVQVIANLLSNAAKYTPDGGRIELLLEAQARTLTISIRDNGIGMSPELIDNAFNLFSQGAQGLDRSQGGLGIGLALVKSLVHLHAGTVSAKSDGPGNGSLLQVTLPRIFLKTHPVSEEFTSDNGLTRPLRIAIVDDNEDAAVMLGMYIQDLGHKVVIEHSAAHALKKLPTFTPDVCILDIGLPEMHGFDLARALRECVGSAEAAFIAVTGYAQEKDREEAYRTGFYELLAKPVDLGTLENVLRSIAASREAT